MRIVAWNIRAGGGGRVGRIGRQLARWKPDVVALSEFRATPPSLALATVLAAGGLTHQLTTADPGQPGRNALLVASRWPLRQLRLPAQVVAGATRSATSRRRLAPTPGIHPMAGTASASTRPSSTPPCSRT